MVGVFLLVRDFIEVSIHAYILRSHTHYGRWFGRQAIEHAFIDGEVQRVSAQIFEGLDSVVNYCLKLGFKREGFQRNACWKGGKLIGVHLLGITREEWQWVS